MTTSLEAIATTTVLRVGFKMLASVMGTHWRRKLVGAKEWPKRRRWQWTPFEKISSPMATATALELVEGLGQQVIARRSWWCQSDGWRVARGSLAVVQSGGNGARVEKSKKMWEICEK